jgi:transcriptional regulator with XRE-family HTH domain
MQTHIREVRQARGWKQKDLAARIGKTAATLSKYEHGRMEISATLLCRIAEVLDVSVTCLLMTPRGRRQRGSPAA